MHMQYQPDAREALAAPAFGRLYALTGVVGLLVAADVVLWLLGRPTGTGPSGVSLALLAALLGGARIVYGAVIGLLEGQAGADLALAIALVASLVLGQYWVAAEVVLIALVGESLEALTFGHTQRALSRILELSPRRVRVRRQASEFELPVEEVLVGDTVLVRPGERIAVDGRVTTGRSAVDQSMLTGESIPIDKAIGDEVHAGTLNQFGALEIEAERIGNETTLGQVIRLVAQARSRKARVERVVDRLARLFLPLVLAAAALTFVVTNREPLAALWSGGPVGTWKWMPTLAVLVVTCPCALVLATPAAMLAALAWTARRGVLVKGGDALERLATVRAIAFDKTGTLTTGRLEVVDIAPLGTLSENELLALAAAAERPSEHLLAVAIRSAAENRKLELPEIADFVALPGAGVRAQLTQGELLVGNARLLREQGIELDLDARVIDTLVRLEADGQTTLLVALAGRVEGVLGLRDTLRPEASDVIRQLRAIGIVEVAMLTGDRPSAARAIARQVGIDRLAAELRPDEKAAWLAAWSAHPSGNKRPALVAMIGDGINDAPALAAADVGVALGGIGCDLAAEAGDIVMLGSPLTPLPNLILLSRQVVRIIHENILVFALATNVLGIVLTAWLLPLWSPAWEARSPVAAALFHQLGSVLVLLNSMRLLAFERWRNSWFGRLEDSLCNWLTSWSDQLPSWTDLQQRWAPYGPRLAAGTFGVALVAYLSTCLTLVGPDEVAVVRRCGRLAAILEPGLHMRLPWPWETAQREQPERVQVIRFGMPAAANGPSEAKAPKQTVAVEWNSPHGQPASQREATTVLAGNQSLVELGATIQYRIDDLPAWLFGVRDARQALAEVAVGTVCDVAAAFPVVAREERWRSRELLAAGRAEVESEIARQLQQRIDELKLGVRILDRGVCLEDVHPPLEVVPAFREVSSAFKEKGRLLNEADAEYRRQVILAGGTAAWRQLSQPKGELTPEVWSKLRGELTGEAAAGLLAAEAFATTRENEAAGEAAHYRQVEHAESAAPAETRWRLSVEAMSTALAGKPKLILDSKLAGRRHLLLAPPSFPSNLIPNLLAPPAQPTEE